MGRLILLAAAAFIAQTSEYLPISAMSGIRDELSVSESAVGVLVTGYAWIAALTAAPLTMLTTRWDRKILFLVLLGVISLAGLIGAVAPNYGLLAIARIFMAFAHGIFWAMLAIIALGLAPAISRTKVLAVVFAGISVASVAGIPLSAYITQVAGWRWAFASFALGAAILTIVAFFTLPRMPFRQMDQKPVSVFGNHRLRKVIAATAFIVAGHFCAYTYIVPLIGQSSATSGAFVPGLLFIFGMAGVVGVFLSGWLALSTSCLAIIATTGIVLSQIVFGFAESPLILGLVLVLWGASSVVVVIGLQGTAIETAPNNVDMASAYYVAAFNVGIGTGALMGGFLSMFAPYTALLWTGAALATLGLMFLLNLRKTLDKS